MRIVLLTLCLNEMEWLPKLYQQHKSWPGLLAWIFVESADFAYAKSSPGLVGPGGLSVDGTGDYLASLAANDTRVRYLPFGISIGPRPDLGKIAARNASLRIADEYQPDQLIVLDADEFYDYEDQQRIPEYLATLPDHTACSFRFRHPWRPPSIQGEPLFQKEVVGGFWEMNHCHVFRWLPGLRYASNHNSPETLGGMRLNTRLARADRSSGAPECVHMAFSSRLINRKAKHRYYAARGEGSGDGRGWYVESRGAWEKWSPVTKRLPRGAKVVPYTGPIPEVFRTQEEG